MVTWEISSRSGNIFLQNSNNCLSRFVTIMWNTKKNTSFLVFITLTNYSKMYIFPLIIVQINVKYKDEVMS